MSFYNVFLSFLVFIGIWIPQINVILAGAVNRDMYVPVNLAQSVKTIYNIYNVQSSNIGHHKKKKKCYVFK